jgi:hypothetical protein
MNKYNSYLFLLLSISLIGMVMWGFAIREQMDPANHYLYPVSFLILFIIQCILAYRLMKRSRIVHGFQPLPILAFIILDLYLLVSVSTLKRENEIRNYFAKHENALNKFVDHFQSFGDDTRIHEMKEEMKIERVRHASELLHVEDKKPVVTFNLRMYTCLGYGYGVLYACEDEIEQPKNLGGSPVTKWMKLKDHWFYYSIFD